VGYVLNNPGHNSRNNASYAIGRVRWAPGQIKTALFIGNGYGTSAVSLVIVNLEDVMSRATGASSAWDPSLVKVVSVPSLGGRAWNPSLANGLASPTAVDTDFDGVVDTVYSGDFQGNIWKFDLSSPSGAWRLASSKSGIGLPLFRAKLSGQQITTAPLVVEGCTAVGRIVTFGTGSVLDEVALRSTTPNTIYGILDDAIYPTQPYTSVPFSKLLNHPFLTSGNYRYNNRVRVNYPATMGWFVDLSYASERVITSPMMYGGNVLFSTYIPTAFTDSCDAQEGQGALVSLDVCNGSSPENPFFDTNNDRVVDGGDHASWNAGLFASSKKYTGPVTLGRVLNKNIYSDPTARTGKQTICQLVNSRESTSVGCAPMIRKRASWREIRQKP
jgi:Tfp pilus tip-associated adhesin PilY1